MIRVLLVDDQPAVLDALRQCFALEPDTPPQGDLPRLKPAAEEALYRITQEALHNVVKHARATRAVVSIQARDGFVILQVRDDGIGFAADTVPAGHMGLDTMRQRAEALGGFVSQRKPARRRHHGHGARAFGRVATVSYYTSARRIKAEPALCITTREGDA